MAARSVNAAAAALIGQSRSTSHRLLTVDRPSRVSNQRAEQVRVYSLDKSSGGAVERTSGNAPL